MSANGFVDAIRGWSCWAAASALSLMLCAWVVPVEAQPGYITTVAGGGLGVDGGPAVGASLAQPYSVAVDAAGNFYIADTDAQRIRKVTVATGIISTVAGTGAAGSGGDGGPATAASLNYPVGIAVDAAGNLYIAEYVGHRIRKVNSATGVISTYAGKWDSGLWRRRGNCHRGVPECALGSVARRCREPLHCGLRQQPHPEGRRGWRRHQHNRGVVVRVQR